MTPAVNIVSDALNNVFDRMILVTADTDQIPTIEAVRSLAPAKQDSPPVRIKQAREIGALVADRFEITKGAIGTCRLPRVVMDASGAIVAVSPNEYQ